MEVPSRRYIDVNEYQIHYREIGSGTPMILLHEMPLSSLVFEKLMPYLQEDFHVVAPDLPGFGSSRHPKEKLTISDYASILLEFMKTLRIEKVAVLGVHGGASIAIEMAKQEPQSISSLILSGVPIFNEEEREKFHQSLKPLVIKNDGSHFTEWWEYFSNKWENDTPDEVIHRSVMQIMEAGPRYEWGYRAAFDYNPTSALKEIAQPVFLLVAEGDVLVSKNKETMEHIPGVCKEEIVPIAGHLSQRVPKEMANSVKQFIKELGL